MNRAEIVEAMARPAHEAWMRWYTSRGITSRQAAWGEEFLVPWHDLSEQGRDLDREIMRSILDAFDSAGLAVVPREEHEERIRYLKSLMISLHNFKDELLDAIELVRKKCG